MKNLKKVLSVVLAVALMVSMIAVAGATTAGEKMYDDYAEIDAKYVDAVDLLTELEVIEGDQNIGKFMPKDTLDRAQMTKIVAYVRAQKDLSKWTTFERLNAAYASLVTFTDVSKTAWYAGPVGYAQQVAIVAGCGDNTFAPNRAVTMVEAAKMLLVVLGYDCEKENIGGAGWAGATTALAFQNGLFDGLDVTDVNRAITREEMAQMTYNMLLADTVYYEEGCCKCTINQGQSAINYYFGKDVNVTTGVVIANAFANLGHIDYEDIPEDADYWYGYVDPEEVGEENVEWVSYTFNKGTAPSVTRYAAYDPATEIVLAIKAGTCIGTGYCSGKHNFANYNCPATTDEDILVVITVKADENPIDVIGREVKVAALANHEQLVTYDTLVITANNAADYQYANGAIVTDPAIAKDTLIVAHHDIYTEEGATGVWYDAAPELADDPTTPLVDESLTWVNPNGGIILAIDNDNDTNADYIIGLESQLYTSIAAFDTNKNGAIDALDGYVFEGYTPVVGDVYLAYVGIDGVHVYAYKLTKQTGVIESYVGDASCDIFFWFNGRYEIVKFEDTDDIEYSAIRNREIAFNTKYAIGDNYGAEGLGCAYYLDLGGNLVKIDLTDARESVTALWYGIERTGLETYSSTSEGIGYDIIGIKEDGTEVRVTLGDGIFFSDVMDEENIWALGCLFNNELTVYAKVSFDRFGLVNDIEALSGGDFTYTKGTLVLGTESDDEVISESDRQLDTKLEDVEGFVNDETYFANFNVGQGGYFIPVKYAPIADQHFIEDINNSINAGGKNVIGEVTMTKGPASVVDVFNYADFEHVTAYRPYGVGDYAELVVLNYYSEEGYKALEKIENVAVDLLADEFVKEYVFINKTMFDGYTRVSKGTLNVNGDKGFVYTVPCIAADGTITSIDIDEYEFASLDAKLHEDIVVFEVERTEGKYVVELDRVDFMQDAYEFTVATVSATMDRFSAVGETMLMGGLDGSAYTFAYTDASRIMRINYNLDNTVSFNEINGDDLVESSYDTTTGVWTYDEIYVLEFTDDAYGYAKTVQVAIVITNHDI